MAISTACKTCYTSRHLIRQNGSCCLKNLLVLQNSCVLEDEEGRDFNFLDWLKNFMYDLISVSFRTRKHSSRMRTARLVTVHVWWPPLDYSSWGVSIHHPWAGPMSGELSTRPLSTHPQKGPGTRDTYPPSGQND